MDFPETLETLGSQDTGKRQTKQAKNKTKQHNTENVKYVKHGPRQKRGGEPMSSRRARSFCTL